MIDNGGMTETTVTSEGPTEPDWLVHQGYFCRDYMLHRGFPGPLLRRDAGPVAESVQGSGPRRTGQSGTSGLYNRCCHCGQDR